METRDLPPGAPNARRKRRQLFQLRKRGRARPFPSIDNGAAPAADARAGDSPLTAFVGYAAGGSGASLRDLVQGVCSGIVGEGLHQRLDRETGDNLNPSAVGCIGPVRSARRWGI